MCLGYESISVLQGKSMFSLSQKKSSSQRYSSLLATQHLFSSFNLDIQQKSGTGSKHGGLWSQLGHS